MRYLLLILIVCFPALCPEVYGIEKIWQTKAHDGLVHKILFSIDGKHIISAGTDKKLKIIDANIGEILSEYNFVTTPNDLFLQSDNRILISFKHWKNSAVCSYDISDSNCYPNLDLRILLDSSFQSGQHEFMESHAVPLANNRIITGIGIYSYATPDHYYEGRLDLWNNNIPPIPRKLYSGGMITNLAISPDNMFIAFSTLYRSSKWEAPYVYRDIEASQLILTDTSFADFYILRSDSVNGYDTVDSEVFNGIAFSKDSKILTAATDEHNIYTFDINDRILRDSIYSCSCYFDWSIDFVYDGEHVIAGSNDGKVGIWNLQEDIKIDSYTFDGTPSITSIAASNNKNLYAVGNSDGDIALMFSHYLTDVNREKPVIDNPFEILNTGDYLYFKYQDLRSQVDVEIFNILGNPVEIINVNALAPNGMDDLFDVDISNLTYGYYFVKATINGQIFIDKFLKYY